MAETKEEQGVNVIIRANAKFKRLGRKIQLRNVADQLSLLAYGRSIQNCLGAKQQLLVSKLRNKQISVYIPSDNDVSDVLEKVPKAIHRSDNGKFLTSEDFIKFIRNITKHISDAGFPITIYN
jgi:hypothetical protein